MEKLDKKIIIISPHCDDEIIGTYNELITYKNIIIIYPDYKTEERQKESQNLRKYLTDVNLTQLYTQDIPPVFLNKDFLYFFPDVNDIHPSHRYWASIGEKLCRDKYEVVFYTTNMNVPWIYEVKESDKKKLMLDSVYTSQRDLWKYDYKYFLFEGKNKWLIQN